MARAALDDRERPVGEPAVRRAARARRGTLLAAVFVLVFLAAVVGWDGTAGGTAPPDTDGAPDPLNIAHAGAQGHAPPNTLPAFERALSLGADVLEMDLQLSADGRLVAFHDAAVDDTTDGTGEVSDLTLAELKRLDAGYRWHDAEGATPFRGEGVEIPTFGEVVTAFPDTPLVVEMKTDSGPRIVDALARAVDEHELDGRVTVASFDRDHLEAFRRRHPAVPTTMAEDEVRRFVRLGLVGLDRWVASPGDVLQVPEVHEGTRVVTPGVVAAARRHDTDVHVWTVNDEAAMHRLLNTGVDGVITDYPDRFAAVLAEREVAARQSGDPASHPGLGLVQELQSVGWLNGLAKVVTVLGDEELYVLALPLLYWCVHRRIGVEVGVLLLTSAGLNQALKLAVGAPRPLFLDPSVGLRPETSFALPSGHAQHGVAVLGLLAREARRRWATAAAVALVLLLGWSRVQLGAHFPVDVLVGWAVGLALLAGYLAARRPAAAWLARHGPWAQAGAALGVSLGLVALGVAARVSASGWVPPATWLGVDPADPPVDLGRVVAPAAVLFGAALGMIWQSRRGGFDAGGAAWRRLVRYLVGMAALVALAEGGEALLPTGGDPVALLATSVHHALVGAWVSGLAPWLFVRLGLAEPGAPRDPSAAPSAS